MQTLKRYLEQTPASIARNIWPILRTHQNLTPCYLSTALSLANWKRCLQQIPSWPPIASFKISISNTNHHSRPTVCLPDSLALDPLPVDFVLVKCLWISWFTRFRLCERCRNLEFTKTIYDYDCHHHNLQAMRGFREVLLLCFVIRFQ